MQKTKYPKDQYIKNINDMSPEIRAAFFRLGMFFWDKKIEWADNHWRNAIKTSINPADFEQQGKQLISDNNLIGLLDLIRIDTSRMSVQTEKQLITFLFKPENKPYIQKLYSTPVFFNNCSLSDFINGHTRYLLMNKPCPHLKRIEKHLDWQR